MEKSPTSLSPASVVNDEIGDFSKVVSTLGGSENAGFSSVAMPARINWVGNILHLILELSMASLDIEYYVRLCLHSCRVDSYFLYLPKT